MKLKKGYSRIVLLIGNYAIKIAKPKYGRRCNIGELHYSQLFPNSELFNKHLYTMICPVLFSFFNCWVIVMPRCKEYTGGYETDAFNTLSDNIRRHRIPAELLMQNIGWWNNKLVCFDYYQ